MVRIALAALWLAGGLVVALAQAPPGASKSAPARAATPKSPPADDRRCVGIISNLGETFTIKKVGLIVFQNEEHKFPIESWRIDDLVTAKIGAALGNQAIARRIALPKGTLASLDTPAWFRDYEADLVAALRPLMAGTRCSRYVAVTSISSTYATTNQLIGGAGIVTATASLGRAWLHAFAMLRLYEGGTFVLLKRKPLSDGRSTFMSGIPGPYREIEQSLWAESTDVPRNAGLRDATRGLVDHSMNQTLPELLPRD